MSEARRVTAVSGCTTEILAIALSADGMSLATGGSENNTIQIWDASTGKELWSDLPHELEANLGS